MSPPCLEWCVVERYGAKVGVVRRIRLIYTLYE